MALALPFLQAVLKTYFIPHAPLLNFMRALAYGFALAGVTLLAIFGGWLLSDKSHGFNTAVPALCVSMKLKKVRCAAQNAAITTPEPARVLPSATAMHASSFECARLAELRVPGRHLCVGCPCARWRLEHHPGCPVTFHQPLARRNRAWSRREAAAFRGACLPCANPPRLTPASAAALY